MPEGLRGSWAVVYQPSAMYAHGLFFLFCLVSIFGKSACKGGILRYSPCATMSFFPLCARRHEPFFPLHSFGECRRVSAGAVFIYYLGHIFFSLSYFPLLFTHPPPRPTHAPLPFSDRVLPPFPEHILS